MQSVRSLERKRNISVWNECYPITINMSFRVSLPRRHRFIFPLYKQARRTSTLGVEPVNKCSGHPKAKEVQLHQHYQWSPWPDETTKKVRDSKRTLKIASYTTDALKGSKPSTNTTEL